MNRFNHLVYAISTILFQHKDGYMFSSVSCENRQRKRERETKRQNGHPGKDYYNTKLTIMQYTDAKY